MTRCGKCRGFLIDSPHHVHTYEWMRADPDYDDPLPSMVSMLPAAIVVVIVGLLLLILALAVLAGPEVR